MLTLACLVGWNWQYLLRLVGYAWPNCTVHLTEIGSTCHDWSVVRVPKSACLPEWNWQYLS